MVFDCERCGYSSKLKTNLKRHLEKKIQCKLITSSTKTSTELLHELYKDELEDINYLCECGNKYKYQSNLCRHQHNCEQYLQSKKLKELEEIVQALQQNNNNLLNANTNGDHNNINNNSNNNIVNHNIIIVNNFGNEDISYLSPEFIEKCTCYLSLGIKSMAKAIHLNKNHPENHTMKVTNVKSPFIPVIQDQKWILKDKKDVLKFLIEKIADILKSHFDDNKEGIKEKYNSYKRDAIEMYHERLEKEDKELWNKIMKDVYLMFANDKEIFPKTRKKKEKVSTG